MKEMKSIRNITAAVFLSVQFTIIFASGNISDLSNTRSALTTSSLNMKVLVPAYFDPSESNYWNRLEVQAAKMPDRLYAIANKANGPGPSYDTTYAVVINNMHLNHGKVIGYVWTNYGTVPLATAKADIDRWFSFYSSLDGIFFDGQANSTGKETYYLTLYNYVKQKNTSALIVSNPGTNTLNTYLIYNGARVSDVICVFESNTGFDTWTPASWCKNYSADNFYVLPYNTASKIYPSRLNKAVSLNVGWIYLTDDTGGNPWDTLPSYFEDMCNYIINGASSVEKINSTVPVEFELSQNYPNPFNPTTIINFSVPKTGFVTIKVYDLLGREVSKLVNENKPAGNYSVEFNAAKLVSGVYFYRIQAGEFIQTKKLLYLK